MGLSLRRIGRKALAIPCHSSRRHLTSHKWLVIDVGLIGRQICSCEARKFDPCNDEVLSEPACGSLVFGSHRHNSISTSHKDRRHCAIIGTPYSHMRRLKAMTFPATCYDDCRLMSSQVSFLTKECRSLVPKLENIGAQLKLWIYIK